MSEVKVKHSASASGSGTPTAKDLKDVLKAIPDAAKVKFNQYSRQMDGDSWSLSAEWDNAVQDAWKPPFQHHKPGYRGGVSGTVPRTVPLSEYKEGNPSFAPEESKGVDGYGSQLR